MRKIICAITLIFCFVSTAAAQPPKAPPKPPPVPVIVADPPWEVRQVELAAQFALQKKLIAVEARMDALEKELKKKKRPVVNKTYKTYNPVRTINRTYVRPVYQPYPVVVPSFWGFGHMHMHHLHGFGHHHGFGYGHYHVWR